MYSNICFIQIRICHAEIILIQYIKKNILISKVYRFLIVYSGIIKNKNWIETVKNIKLPPIHHITPQPLTAETEENKKKKNKFWRATNETKNQQPNEIRQKPTIYFAQTTIIHTTHSN